MIPPYLRPGFALRLVCLVAFVGLLNWAMLPTGITLGLLAEAGPIENATVVLWYVAIVAVWLLRPPGLSRLTALALTWVLMALVARELDLHKTLHNMSVLKVRFWTGDLPVESKLLALTVMAPLIAAIIYLGVKYTRWLRTGWSRRDVVASTTATFFLAAVVAKSADRSVGILYESFGYAAPPWAAAMMQSIEEPLELLLPVVVVIAVAQASMLAVGATRTAATGNPPAPDTPFLD